MSSEREEQNAPVKRSPQSSFSRALEIFSSKATLTLFKEKAKKVVGKSDVYICSSTGNDDKEKFFFAVDTDDQDEEKLTRLGRKFEKLHGLTEWMVVRKQSETPQQFSRMYKNLTLLSPGNLAAVQAFVEQCKAEETQLASETKKLRK